MEFLEKSKNSDGSPSAPSHALRSAKNPHSPDKKNEDRGIKLPNLYYVARQVTNSSHCLRVAQRACHGHASVIVVDRAAYPPALRCVRTTRTAYRMPLL